MYTPVHFTMYTPVHLMFHAKFQLARVNSAVQIQTNEAKQDGTVRQSRVYQYKLQIQTNEAKQDNTVRQSRVYQYKYRIYKAKQDGTSNEWSPSSEMSVN